MLSPTVATKVVATLFFTAGWLGVVGRDCFVGRLWRPPRNDGGNTGLIFLGEFGILSNMQKVAVSKTEYQTRTPSLRRLEAHRALLAWRKKNAKKFRGLDSVKIIRAMREGKLR